MPFPPRRRGSRLIGGILGMATAVSLVGLAAPSYADDDYPYRGLGQCPLVPLPPQRDSTPSRASPASPATRRSPGRTPRPSQPGSTATPHGPTGTPTDPPRACAKHIWYYNGTYGDPWGFALRNCTSFVAWRLRNTNGLTDFSNNVDGGAFGNADQWDDNAQALGYLVDDIPAVGAVAQTDTGRVGHVAWVSARGCRHRHRRGVQLLRPRRLRHPHRADLGLPLPAPRRRVPGPESGLHPRGRDDCSGRRRHLDGADHAAGRPDPAPRLRARRTPRDAGRLVDPRRTVGRPGHPRPDLGRRRCRRTGACSPRTRAATRTSGRNPGRSRAVPGRPPRPRPSPWTDRAGYDS